MTPRELKLKYGFTYAKLAVLLQKDQRTIERYCNNKEEDIPPAVMGYCYLLDFWFIQKGIVPPPYIFLG